MLALPRRVFSSSASVKPIAVVLSGCGVFDGSEIQEAVSVLIHTSKAGRQVKVFAPNKPQLHVVNHLTGEPAEKETRNVLVESARIARGDILPLDKLSVTAFDAVIFPGGFGAAKNLSSFALDGASMTVDPEVASVLTQFHAARKPIGLCCIAPVLAARVLPGVSLTVGSEEEEGGVWPYAGTAKAIVAMGGTHVPKPVTEAYVDEKNLVVTAPAYMKAGTVGEIFDSVGAMVSAVLKLASK